MEWNRIEEVTHTHRLRILNILEDSNLNSTITITITITTTTTKYYIVIIIFPETFTINREKYVNYYF